MAFGKPKKVGMKRAAKKKVPVADPVADDDAPPSPPPVATEPSPDPPGLTAGLAVLPSPGRLVLDGLRLGIEDARGMLNEATRQLRIVEKQATANAEAAPARCVAVRYASNRARQAMKPYTALGKLWEIKYSLAQDELEVSRHQMLQQEYRAELRAAQIRLLEEKLRQMAKHVPVRVQRRFGHRASRANPMARFKFSPTK